MPMKRFIFVPTQIVKNTKNRWLSKPPNEYKGINSLININGLTENYFKRRINKEKLAMKHTKKFSRDTLCLDACLGEKIIYVQFYFIIASNESHKKNMDG